MPKVIIIPYNQIESVCQSAMTFANSCQSDFTFYLLPLTKLLNSPLNKNRVEYTEILEHLESIRNLYNYEEDDLILTFYNGILQASAHGLTNLFLAGSRYDDIPPCTGVISTKYLDWNILEIHNYEVQKHSILHLIVCAIIGSYTYLEAHSNIGCLLDFNDELSSFNLKLQKGYYLCSKMEYGCYDKILKGKYGLAILRLCESFKNSNYHTIIEEYIMWDKIQVGDITNNSGQIVIGKDIRISTSPEEVKQVSDKIEELIKLFRQENIEDEQRQSLITNFDKVKEEIVEEKQLDKAKIFKWLSKTKKILENVVLANHTREVIHWIYESFQFVIKSIS
jgi:hypothetical protein